MTQYILVLYIAFLSAQYFIDFKMNNKSLHSNNDFKQSTDYIGDYYSIKLTKHRRYLLIIKVKEYSSVLLKHLLV